MRDNATQLHSNKGSLSGQNHFSFCVVLRGIDLRGAAVDFVENHLTYVPMAAYVWELASLIGEHGFMHLISCDENIMLRFMLLCVLCFFLPRGGSMLDAVPSSLVD